jgi:TPR repeat protein
VLERAEERLAARFASRTIPYPPRTATLVAFKREARLELWVDAGSGWQFVRSYLVRAASGHLGPKLREGDHQVPEGVYRIVALNPNSRYHLSLQLDYPSAFDRSRAAEDGRSELGGNIMIHGSNISDGCLAVGDSEIEELFALTSRVGAQNVTVIIGPTDLRYVDPSIVLVGAGPSPAWLGNLHARIADALTSLPSPQDAPPVAPGHLVLGSPRCRIRDAADCMRRCDAGDMASCARAGVMYASGWPRRAAETGQAWKLLRKACEGGEALGCAELSQLYLTDDGFRRDAARAAELAEAACNAGDGHGCAYLAALCADHLLYAASSEQCSATHINSLRERAVAILGKDCAGWGAYDCYRLSTIYWPGDPTTALRFATASCRGGDPNGCDRLGIGAMLGGSH